MGILDKLVRTIRTASQEWTKEESYVKGEAFEKYLADHIFPNSDYELIYRTSSFTENNQRYASASKLPDYRFRCKATGRQFYVEAKFRSGYYWKDDKLEWTYPEQLARYKHVDTHDAPVFLALGLGDKGTSPENLFLIPLNKINYCGFYESLLRKYEVHPSRPVYNAYLWKLRN